MQIDSKLSKRINQARFILIILVVYIHSNVFVNRFNDGVDLYRIGNWTKFIVGFLSETIACCAMPFFFLLSGFLFFNNYALSRQVYLKKLKSRVRSLLIPLIVWNVFIIVAVYVCKFIPGFDSYFTTSRFVLSGSNIMDILRAILGIGREPIVYQLWFLHDLFILVILSPFAWIIIKKTPVMIVLLGFLWFVGIKIRIPLFDSLGQIISPLFFLIGGFFAVNEFMHNKLVINGRIVIIWFLLMALVDAYCQIFNMGSNILYTLFHNCVIILGIISVWEGILLFPEHIQRFITKLSAYSFFLFAAHEPILSIFRKLLYRLYPPKYDVVVIFYYLLCPFLTICFCLAVGVFLKVHFLKLYNIMTGDRN